MKKIVFILFTICSLMSCDQYVSRKWGGTSTITLQPGEKLVEATWKDANLWYLTEPMEDDYVPKTKTFQESSVCGVMEGKVIFIERR
jgi:hypothetical protein